MEAIRTAFQKQGFYHFEKCVKHAIPALRMELERWVEESRKYTAGYGKTCQGRTRFEVNSNSQLLRVQNPGDISDVYLNFLLNDSSLLDAVEACIGPNIKYNCSRVNTKLAQSKNPIDFHQDWAFEPASNLDVVVCCVCIDPMTEKNGALQVVPGSHNLRLSHIQNDRFTGKIHPNLQNEISKSAIPIIADPGDVLIFSHGTIHGSSDNTSTKNRSVILCDYSAADTLFLSDPWVKSEHFGTIVRGAPTRMVRFGGNGEIELPPHLEYGEDYSFFQQQESANTAAGFEH